ncbi:flagellar hook-length control protein FliK [Paenalkalicoccus suaedae]|uniref:Flagellar hook-length control protein FliK n=1 Tax=Paenalkalicoccus suaedae TaxID=2592382 RepID=A0A859FGU8_9BACI|nr:flagellar hook-length control protein FliK [Paenalkalicoccus suaedae]QKS71435.1 flagellar hook-length control protein FliK [Paenalkalicoccus suaedae]
MINGMMVAQPVTQAVPQTSGSQTTTSANSFLALLGGLLHNGEALPESLQEETSLQELLPDSTLSPEELDSLLALLEELPVEDLFVTENTVELLEELELPDAWLEEIKQLVSVNPSLSALFSEFTETGNPTVLLAALGHLHMVNQQAPLSPELKQVVMNVTATMFNQVDEKKDFTMLLPMLKEAIPKELPAFSQVPKAFTRIAELAYLNHATKDPGISKDQFARLLLGQQMPETSTERAIVPMQGFQQPAVQQQPTLMIPLMQQEGQTRVSQEQFIRQFENLLQRSAFTEINGMKQMTIKLHPQHLGRLDIQIQQLNGVITARVMTSNAMTRELLDSQLHHLKQAFQSQQLQVEKVEISQQQPFKDSTSDGQRKDQQKEESSRFEHADEEVEQASFEELLEESIDVEV